MLRFRFATVRRLVVVVGCFLVLVFGSGCGAAATPAPAAPSSANQSRPAPAATTAPMAQANTNANPNTNNTTTTANAIPIDRRIIKNSQLTMTVTNIDVAIVQLTGITNDVGGYLVSNRTFVEGNRRNGQVTLAVPVDRFEEALNLVRKVAYVIHSDIATSADVTEQFTDLQSRLRNLEATSARIRDFLAKATTVKESLEISAQLSEVDKQIEEIKGKLNAMNARTTFSTITADLRELPPTAPPAPPAPLALATATPAPLSWKPSETFKAASDTQNKLFSALVLVVGDTLIWFSVVVLPYVLGGLVIAWSVRSVAQWLTKPPRMP